MADNPVELRGHREGPPRLDDHGGVVRLYNGRPLDEVAALEQVPLVNTGIFIAAELFPVGLPLSLEGVPGRLRPDGPGAGQLEVRQLEVDEEPVGLHLNAALGEGRFRAGEPAGLRGTG